MRSPGHAARQHHNIAEPVAGYYRRRMVSGAVWMPVKIWFGAPLDPETGEELDRSLRWQAMDGDRLVTGEAEIQNVWTSCCREPINATEYFYLVADRAWCRENAPESPEANPTKRIDLNSLPSLF